MKLIFANLLLIGAVFVSSCHSNPSNDSSGAAQGPPLDTANKKAQFTIPVSGTYCFQKLAGQGNQDTATLQLTLSNGTVTGTFNDLLSQKDSRRGTLKGSLKDSVLTATWYIMQEGRKDSLPAVFKWTKEGLLQKLYAADPRTGKEFIADTSKFAALYSEIDCSTHGGQ